ncbi:MAG: LCP family protein [Humibacillus sp.]|nr:LCP family protein [Humibacillus sp.]MDN5776537.1 LCP family protein [Humibacillus sp.]
MPTEPENPHEHDDAYTVDTRRKRGRPASTSGSPAPRASPPPAQRDAQGSQPHDDAYTVDTRGRSPRETGSTGRQTPSGSSVPPQEPRPNSLSTEAGAPRRRIRKGRLIALVIGLVLVSWIAFLVWVPFNAWNAVGRVDNIPSGERPPDTTGHNYLLVGSDSREGLTAAQKKALTTGSAEGKRTDTIMLVHVSESGGKPVMVSIPRDSYVPIPGYRSNKINAAYSFGGAKLLTETVENVTGIHIDGYVEIGLGGFASVVDSVGGVRLCVPRHMVDKKAGIDLKKGCQTLDGPNALGYVRSRYEDPLGDIGRAARQRQFLGALMKQAATPSTVLLPWRYKSFADAAAGGLTVGTETGLMDAVRVLQAMRAVSNDQGLSLSVPTADLAYRTSNGLAVKWDTERAKALFTAIKNDEPLETAPAGTTVKEVGNS